MHGAGVHDYFRLSTPRSALESALNICGIALAAVRDGVVLGLERQETPTERIRLDERFVAVVPFPHGTISLAKLLLDPTEHPPGGAPHQQNATANLYLPRKAFDRIADTLGSDRIAHLPLCPGAAVGDRVIENLSASLTPAIRQPASVDTRFIDHIGKAFNTHLAQRYGGMQTRRAVVVGGLTPLQLRRVRDNIDARLDQEISLAQLAGDCGLSTSHFARAFARSTGVPPHRWLTQRRVERAKELMQTEASLAEIALMCGFSDQSHLTRVFAQAVGVTPGRWRGSQHSPGAYLAPTAQPENDAR